MDKIKTHIQNQLDECTRIKNTANDALKVSVEHYLTAHASTAYRAEIIEEFYTDLMFDVDLDNVTAEELRTHLMSLVNRYQGILLSGRPLVFNTNQMVNLTRLWKFETYADLLKHIRTLLNYL